jgi:Uma2 family endonuclease
MSIITQQTDESIDRGDVAIKPELALEAIVYPESDGKPMAENTTRYRWLTRIKDGLEARFKDDPQVFVAGDLFWYPVKGQTRLNQAPDVMVAVGRPKGDRGSYKQWEEDGVAPQVVFEIWSPNNTKEDIAEKFAFYDYFGVEEYYTHDPDAKVMAGWRRHEERLGPITDMNEWESPRLNVTFRCVEGEWNLYHPNGSPFQDYIDLHTAKEEATRIAEVERAAKEAAWAKLRELGIDPEKL